MYRIRYFAKAVQRWLLFHLNRSELVYGTYDNPADVMGYTGWHELNGDVIAFTHETDGLQFYW